MDLASHLPYFFVTLEEDSNVREDDIRHHPAEIGIGISPKGLFYLHLLEIQAEEGPTQEHEIDMHIAKSEAVARGVN
jgi:hypothetical protein